MENETAAAPKPTTTPAPAARPAAEQPGPETTDQKVRRWMHETLAGGPLARNTELWNVVHDALPSLVAIIDGK